MNAARGTRRPHATRARPQGRSGGGSSGDAVGPGGCLDGLIRFFRGLFWLAVIVLAIYIVAVAL